MVDRTVDYFQQSPFNDKTGRHRKFIRKVKSDEQKNNDHVPYFSSSLLTLSDKNRLNNEIVKFVRIVNRSNIIELFIKKTEGFDLFKLFLNYEVPHHILDKYIELELDIPDKYLIFRSDFTPASRAVIEFIKCQSNFETLIDRRLTTSWGNQKVLIEQKSNELLLHVSKVIRDIEKCITKLNPATIYLCKRISDIAAIKNLKSQHIVMTVLFLRIIIPTFIRGESESISQIQRRNLVQIAKVIQSIVGSIVSGLSGESIANIDALATYNIKKIANIQEMILHIVDKLLIEGSKIDPGRILFNCDKLNIKSLLKVIDRMSKIITEKKYDSVANFIEHDNKEQIAVICQSILQAVSNEIRSTNQIVETDYVKISKKLSRVYPVSVENDISTQKIMRGASFRILSKNDNLIDI
jgi:hypothetical protein